MKTSNNKIIIYSFMPRLFDNRNPEPIRGGSLETNGSGKLSAFTSRLLRQMKLRGITHIWPIGIIRHATKSNYESLGIPLDHQATVKGRAGSPYAINDYYDIDPDLAEAPEMRQEEFEDFVERVHAADLKLIIDFVPNHTARSYKSIAKPAFVKDFGSEDNNNLAFSPNNNYYYMPGATLTFNRGASQSAFHYSEFPAKVTGNDSFTTNPSKDDWYETVKLNYGVDLQNSSTHFAPVPDTWNKMLNILLYWRNRGVDGFRCDMAHMVPLAFWRWVIPQLRQDNPDPLFIAEIYLPELYQSFIDAGFDYLYNKVGLYDSLRDVISKGRSANDIHDSREATAHLEKELLSFMENHDEQRIASDFFGADPKAGLTASAVAGLISPGPFMSYFGQDLGERGMYEEGFSGLDGRTSIFDYWSIGSMQRFVANGAYDESLLTESECELHRAYLKLLEIATTEPLVTNGHYYYIGNDAHGHWGYDKNRHFAFTRHDGHGHILLVVANFTDKAVDLNLKINHHFLDTVGIERNAVVSCTNLKTGQSGPVELSEDAPFNLQIPEWGYSAYRFD